MKSNPLPNCNHIPAIHAFIKQEVLLHLLPTASLLLLLYNCFLVSLLFHASIKLVFFKNSLNTDGREVTH